MKIDLKFIHIIPPGLLPGRNFSISLIIFFIFIQPIYSQSKPDAIKSETINKYLSEIVVEGKAPGMIAAIISGNGIIAIGSAGVRKFGTNIPFSINDVVHLGSCSKAMTATMLATLVAEGKLNWDTKLIEAIPELKNKIHTDYHKITLWQLLTHRAGIPKNPDDWGAFEEKEMKERRLAILKENLKLPTVYKQGEFNYSNFGYMIAACMAEKITGLSWESLMKKRLFDPLGMTSAGFGEPDKRNNIAQPWGHSKWGAKWEPSKSYDPAAIGPAGDIHINIEDWAKFISLQLPGKSTILDRKILDKLIEPVGDYAGGWSLYEYNWSKGKVVYHSGTNGIWSTAVIVAPGIDRAFIVATNSCDFSSTNELCYKLIAKLRVLDSDSGNK